MALSSKYHDSFYKKIFDFSFAFLILLIFSLPFVVIALMIKFSSKGTIFFKQVRMGKNGKKFTIYKFRTMKMNAEKKIDKYRDLNEADGPVFKIRNDPRFTRFGKFLSNTGLDELPQFFNVLKGEISLVGPRPLPIYEYEKLSKKEKIRNVIKPGITSTWVIYGSHGLSFEKWMSLDIDYVKKANFFTDVKVLIKTAFIPLKVFFSFL